MTQPGLAGAPGVTIEHQVKAAYLINFARFVEFPAAVHAATEFTICIEGSAEVHQALAPLQGQQVAGRTIEIRDSRPVGSRCRIAFIGSSVAANLDVGAPDGVLTVSDAPRFIERGGMIELVLRDGRLRFRVNRDAAQAAGLRVPPQILQLAVD